MIISVEEAKKHITTTMEDSVLEDKLQALELAIRGWTNNNFQKKGFRYYCPVVAQQLYVTRTIFDVGDTVQITDSTYNNGIYVIKEISDNMIALDKKLVDEPLVKITKVEYPMDVQMGVLDMLKWKLENGDKVGVQSETISRHSVTYFNMDGDNSMMGYPKSLFGFLKPYHKARF